MKHALLPLLFMTAIHGQEPAGQPAELLDPIVKELVTEQPAANPAPTLEVSPEDILSSKVVYRDGQKFTIQEITPVELTPLPEPPPPPQLTPEQEAQRVARHAAMGQFRSPMLSCTVFDGAHTYIRWTSLGKEPVETYAAWSNVNFHYFNSLNRFKKNDTTYTIFFGIGDTDTAKMTQLYTRRGKTYTPPVIPALPADPSTEPTFVVTEGNPTASDLEPIVALHEIYQNNHAELIAEYQRLTAQRAQEAAERAANPPDPKPDIIIRHWTIEPKEPSETPAKTEGE